MNVTHENCRKGFATFAFLILLACSGLAIGSVQAAESEDAAAAKPKTFAVNDKTLVAWVYLANTTQRAGSVLTLIDDQERFDAIVFGERAPGKWMAGSDFFHRTPADQSSYPQETADDQTLVQMAVVYDKQAVTIYRNGDPYAHYTIDQPQSFDEEVTILLGLRYVGQMGEIGFFSGIIEEARIYDAALDQQTIANLKPNRPSDPPPLGCWTFDDGSAADSMGTFPPGRLRGSARIADGKLELDGKDSYVEISRPRPAVVQKMFYRARSRETGRMWDTWLFLHDDTYYLYYLANRSRSWDNISMATSPDGVHWTELGRVLSKRDGVTWMGTGSTWKSPNYETDKKYFMNFSEWRGPRQTIFFAESSDLVQWKRLDDKYEFKQDTRWYEPNGRWDCIYTIPRPGGGLYGYWTATPKPETGGRFGFGQSLDGTTWEALKPPQTPGVGAGEAGAVEKIGDKYYMMFGTGGIMVTLIADTPQGPFVPSKKNYRLLSGHTYFSRFFPTPDGVLVNHHSIARDRQVSFAPLKSTLIDDEGTLRLGWWKGNERLKDGVTPIRLSTPPAQPNATVRMIDETLDTEAGIILEGRITLPPTPEAPPMGLYIGCGDDHGSAIVTRVSGRCELGLMKSDGSGFQVEKAVDREMDFGRQPTFRLLLKHSLLEFYLNDVLIECYSLPGAATGRIGIMGQVDKIQTWVLERTTGVR